MAFSSFSSIENSITKEPNTYLPPTNVNYPLVWLKFLSNDLVGSSLLNYGTWSVRTTLQHNAGTTNATLSTATLNGVANCGTLVIDGTSAHHQFANISNSSDSNQYLTLGSTGFSIAVWVNFTSFSTNFQGILSLSTNNTNATLYALLGNSNSSQFFFDNIVAAKSHIAGSTLSASTWYHVVWCQHNIGGNTNWDYYINGAAQTSSTNFGYPAVLSFNDAYIGQQAGVYFSGSIADLRIYNYVLSSTDVTTIYNNPV
jgi:concanavalin A-like lectin/glucanase superfamily protein